jgi:hypothetical protein
MQAGSASGVTRQLIKTLALANGVDLPEERLDAVLQQYQIYLQTLARLDTLPLAREAEPEHIFALPKEGAPTDPSRR